MCKKYLGFELFGAAIVFLLVLVLPVMDISEGANAGRKRITKGENGNFYFEDGTKVPAGGQFLTSKVRL